MARCKMFFYLREGGVYIEIKEVHGLFSRERLAILLDKLKRNIYGKTKEI